MEDNLGEDMSINYMYCMTEKALCDIGVRMVLPKIIAVNAFFLLRFLRNLPLGNSGCISNYV